MKGRGLLEYWRELVMVLLMLFVLVLNMSLFENLWSYGEDGSRSAAVVKAE